MNLKETIQGMIDTPGLHITGSTKDLDVIIPIWSDNGILYALSRDYPALNPDRFLPDFFLSQTIENVKPKSLRPLREYDA